LREIGHPLKVDMVLVNVVGVVRGEEGGELSETEDEFAVPAFEPVLILIWGRGV